MSYDQSCQIIQLSNERLVYETGGLTLYQIKKAKASLKEKGLISIETKYRKENYKNESSIYKVNHKKINEFFGEEIYSSKNKFVFPRKKHDNKQNKSDYPNNYNKKETEQESPSNNYPSEMKSERLSKDSCRENSQRISPAAAPTEPAEEPFVIGGIAIQRRYLKS